ncbi:PAS domain-containing protein [Thioclava pacifica]|nr:PAS domain-containing protein [Thioclava pacifica]
MNLETDPHDRFGDEVPFALHELFYSRTDPRGVIQAGNEIFRRVSGYDWSELIGAPHKIVRHPDTPKGVFRLLWDAIQKGHPMGAYVKNRAKNGGWYWVFAVLLPIDGGYLSVRLKPVSELSGRIQKFYSELSARERDETLDPEQSVAILRAQAEASGYASYTAFMAYALSLELAERDRQLRRAVDARTSMLGEMNEAMAKLTKEQIGLLRSFEALQSVPNNMRIVASRLEPSGGPVSAISENYKASSVVISERLRQFVAGRDNLCAQMAWQVARALFLLGCSRVLPEMNREFREEETHEKIDFAEERTLLAQLEVKGISDARAAMLSAADFAAQMTQQSRDIRRQMLGLDTIRVLGRVECGRMRDSSEGLSATIDQLDSFHDDIKSRLEAIMRLSEVVKHSLTRYLRLEQAAA